MPDRLLRLHLRTADLLVVALDCAQSARQACERHANSDAASAELLSEGLAAGLGIAALSALNARVSLQLDGLGAEASLLVDARASGEVRGYLHPRRGAGDPPSGALAILRDLDDGEIYRSTVALSGDLAQTLTAYFETSEQCPTIVKLDCELDPAGLPLRASGLFVQKMPGTAPNAFERAQALLAPGLPSAGDFPDRIAETLSAALEPSGTPPLLQHSVTPRWHCECDREKVLTAALALGADDLFDMLTRQGEVAVDCVFCRRRHRLTQADFPGMANLFKTEGA